ncbi:MAG: hypothetical protein IJC48_10055, partial [Clostridia bacterium]|nr:hypothetical protein [Clostridia bacterium]
CRIAIYCSRCGFFIADLFYNKTELSSTFPVVESSVFFSGLLCNSPFSFLRILQRMLFHAITVPPESRFALFAQKLCRFSELDCRGLAVS